MFVHTGARPEDGVADMTVISDINEFGINTNLKVRYKSDRIYVSSAYFRYNNKILLFILISSNTLQTYSGTILVAVNPYKQLKIYDTVRTECQIIQ